MDGTHPSDGNQLIISLFYRLGNWNLDCQGLGTSKQQNQMSQTKFHVLIYHDILLAYFYRKLVFFFTHTESNKIDTCIPTSQI